MTLKMMSKLLVMMMLATAYGHPQDYEEGVNEYVYDSYDDTSYDEDYDGQNVMPTFTATPQHFSVEVGGDITFPCDVDNLGNQVMMFKHMMPGGDHRMLFVGDIILKPASKFTKDGNSFTLNGVSQRNAGKYACRIETDPITELVHILDVQYRATVIRKSDEVQKVAQGDSVTLECEAEGNPPAAISWSRQQGHLPSGSPSEEGLSITLENVDRHVEGDYICTASNGIGDASSASMAIEVEYAPEIIAEQTIVHTGEGDEAKLLCIVHGRPTPSLTWLKDGEPVRQDMHLQEHDSVHRHTLTIEQVQMEDFGDYACKAENERGQSEHTLRLTGLPKEPRMTSSPAGGENDAYTVTWDTESYTPIVQYRLKYRKYTVNLTSQDHGGWDDRLYSPKPTEDIASGRLHHMSHAIEELEPATDYEAAVSVENKFGWSDQSEIFKFYTRKEDPTTTTTSTTTTTTTTTTTLAPEPENIAPLTEVLNLLLLVLFPPVVSLLLAIFLCLIKSSGPLSERQRARRTQHCPNGRNSGGHFLLG